MSNSASAFTPICFFGQGEYWDNDKFILFIDVLLVHIVNFLNLNYQMWYVIKSTIFYINSENSEELEDIRLRKRYGIATVPALLFPEMVLLRLYVTLLFLRMIFRLT